MEKKHTTYIQAAQKLNEKQLVAVNTIQGPVMVIAGPGTGKTQILASRIANLLLKTDTQADEILCLTFTDSGAIAMRKRLFQFVGNDAYRISIHTFHSFCNRVIQENQDQFDRQNLEPLSELEEIQLLSDLCSTIDKDNPIFPKKGYWQAVRSNLKSLFSFMKKENLLTEDILLRIAKRKLEMREGDEFRYKRKSGAFEAGDLKINQIEKIETSLDKLAAAAQLFPKYQELMLEQKRYDFADMILWVLNLFETKTEIKQNYQEQFQYILVDEFQDTNGAQNDLVRLLTDHWKDQADVFVVGDDDQSIYRFQGAEVENIRSFQRYYEANLKTVVLEENYRSTQKILDASKSLINNNIGRISSTSPKLTKELKASSAIESGNTEFVNIRAFNNPYEEAVWIARDIQSKVEQKIDPSDIAVLYHKHKHIDDLASILKSKGIPVYLKRSENVLHSPIIQHLLFILTYINAEQTKSFSQSGALFTIFHYPYFNIKAVDIAQFSRLAYKNELHRWRETLGQERGELTKIYSGMDESSLFSIKEVADQLDTLISLTHSIPLDQFVQEVMNKLHLLTYSLKSSDRFEIECLKTFFEFVKAELKSDPKIGLGELMKKIQLLEEHHIGLKKERIVYDGKGVNLLTAHASKGLEFRDVYLISGDAKSWEKSRSFGLPFSLSQITGTDSPEVQIEEKRRLFYVAMTRAEANLNISYARQDENGKELELSRFVTEVEEAGNEVVILSSPAIEEDTELIEDIASTLIPVTLKRASFIDEVYLDEFLKTYNLSVTHLNNYLRCPISFYFDSVLRIPSAKNKYMGFGSAVHKALEGIIHASDKSSESILDLFEKAMNREVASFTPEEFRSFIIEGEKILPAYLEHKKGEWAKEEEIQTEVGIFRIEVDGVPIKGVLDKIALRNGAMVVTDFKTGNPERGSKKMKAPQFPLKDGASKEDLIGADYWRQLVFYALLVDGDKRFSKKMSIGEMDFVEPDKNGNFLTQSLQITEEDKTMVKEQITTSFQLIKQKEFSNGCNEDHCYWCQFVRDFY